LRDVALVEAAETLFEPVVIRNNVEGPERDVLLSFGEPTWNNPVIRLVGAEGEDLVPREDGVWSTGGQIARMAAALEAAGRPVPEWLGLSVHETSAGDVETAVFAMT